MAERHDAERSVVEARARLTRIAEELSRRATPDYVKAKAREQAGIMTSRAKVVARERTVEMRDRVLDSPMALGLIGGAVGAVAGKMIGDRTRARHEAERELGPEYYRGYRGEFYGRDYERGRGYDLPYDEYTATHPRSETIITEDTMYGLDRGRHGDQMQGIRAASEESHGGVREKAEHLRERAGETAEHLRERAGEQAEHLRERAQHAASNVRERLPSRDELRERLPSREDVRHGARRVQGSMEHRPELWGVAAIIAGAVFGALMPLSNRERRVLGPVKSDAEGRMRAAKEEIVSRAEAFKEGMKEELTTSGEEGSAGYGGEFDTRYHSGVTGGGGYQAGSTSAEQTNVGAPSTGVVGGYGSDTGFSSGAGSTPGVSGDSGGRTYSAGGTTEEEKREGFNPIPEPDVTRH